MAKLTITFLKGPRLPQDHLATWVNENHYNNPLLVLDAARNYLATCDIPAGTDEIRVSIEGFGRLTKQYP